MDRLRAGLLAVVYALLFLLGTPGLDFLEGDDLVRPEAREQLARRIGPFWATVGLGIYDGARATRVPLVEFFGPIQRPFRISQNWSLYRDGPSFCARLEVQVDGTAIYRSVDPDLHWREEVFRNRRIRPMVESTVTEVKSPNWRSLARWVLQEARKDFPEMQELKMVALQGPFPCDHLKEHHRIVARAPGWTPSLAVVIENHDGG